MENHNSRLDRQRIGVYLLFAFGIAWLAAYALYLNGGLVQSPEIFPGWGVTRATVLIALCYMPAPAFAHVLTRIVTREGWQTLDLRLHWRRSWRYLVLAWWVVPLLATLIGSGLFFALFPQYFDPTMSTIRQLFERTAPGQELPSAWLVIGGGIVQGLLLGGILNSPFTFGEEFGWRGYLLGKLLVLGWRRAVIALGIIWGVWHWPIIALGHNYGLEYPGAPWAGMLAMVWFCLVVGTFLSWVTLRSGSIWPAVVGHAAINAISGLGLLVVTGQPNPLLGPLPTGVIAGVAWSALALWLFWRGAPEERG
jgi:membrane protease YdiL (CAAX protease family)